MTTAPTNCLTCSEWLRTKDPLVGWCQAFGEWRGQFEGYDRELGACQRYVFGEARERSPFTELPKPKAVVSARYEAGMAFEALVGTREASVLERSYGYRAPLRTGIIHVEGVRKLGIIEASKILSWEDIVDPQGRVLVVSWPVGAKEPVEEWL